MIKRLDFLCPIPLLDDRQHRLRKYYKFILLNYQQL